MASIRYVVKVLRFQWRGTTFNVFVSQGPAVNDVVMQICLPGCQKVEKPITLTMNLPSTVNGKGNGVLFWKLGLWDFVNGKWSVLCDSDRTIVNQRKGVDLVEISVTPADVNQYMDPVSSCLLVAPVMNYKDCPGRPYVYLTPSESASIAALSIFGLMLLLQLLTCLCW